MVLKLMKKNDLYNLIEKEKLLLFVLVKQK